MHVGFAFLKRADYYSQIIITLPMPDSRSKSTRLYVIRTTVKGKKKIKNDEKEVVPKIRIIQLFYVFFLMANCAFPLFQLFHYGFFLMAKQKSQDSMKENVP